MSNPCDSKRFYDTEFAAEIAAAKMSYRWETEIIHYRCGTHWHLANKEPKLRSKHRTFARMYCGVCGVYMKRGRWDRHVSRVGHRRNARNRKEEAQSPPPA